MTRGEAVFGTERRSERIDIAEGERKRFAVQLSGTAQMHGLFEKVLRVIHFSVLGTRQVLEVKRGHLEHLTAAFAVRVGQDRRMDINESAILEELVNRRGNNRTDAERG